jgi:hypothetical protein
LKTIALEFSIFSPVMVTSICVPEEPPIGMVVNSLGIGRQTDWAIAVELIRLKRLRAKTMEASGRLETTQR